MVDGMLVCEVWDSLVRPLIEPFDLDCLTALTEDMLLDWPTALSVERDIGDATHYVVAQPLVEPVAGLPARRRAPRGRRRGGGGEPRGGA